VLEVRTYLRWSSLLPVDLGEGKVSGKRKEATAELSIETDADSCKMLQEALKPETSSSLSSRTSTNVEAGPGGLTLRMRSSDLNALRAALNSHIRWIETALRTISLVRKR